MTDSIIAPKPPDDGRDWDCQCARCGSSTIYDHCTDCGGDGWTDEEGWGGSGPQRCDTCGGRGGWIECGSGHAWCSEHPLPGREQVESGAVEWFVIGGAP